MRVHVTYEYSNGAEGVRSFASLDEAHRWIHNEGDHLIDYTIFFSS